MKYLVRGINWDTDGEVVEGLPWRAIVECDEPEDIADTLSDIYGFCILSMDDVLDISGEGFEA